MTDLRGIQTLKFYRRQGDWKWSRKTKNKSPDSPNKLTGDPTNTQVTDDTVSPTPKPVERPRKTSKLPKAQSTQCVQLTTAKPEEDVVPAKPVHQCSLKKTSVLDHRKRPKQSSKSRRNIDENSSKVIETATEGKCGPVDKWSTLEDGECSPQEKRSTVEETEYGPHEKRLIIEEWECDICKKKSTTEENECGLREKRPTAEERECDTCKKISTTEVRECGPRENRSTEKERKYGPHVMRSTIEEIKYGPREKRLTVDERKYGPRGKRSIVIQRKYGPCEKWSTVDERKYAPFEKRSTVEQREHDTRGKTSTIEEGKYGPYEKRSTVDETKCAPCGKSSTVEERKHRSYEKRSTVEERRLRSRERRSNVEETKHGPFNKKKGPHGGSKHSRNQCADPKNSVVPIKVTIKQRIEVPLVVLDDITTTKPKIDAENPEIIAKHELEYKLREDTQEIQSQDDKIAVNKVLDKTFVNTEDVAMFEDDTDDRIGEDKVYCHADVDSNIYQTDDWKTGRIEGIPYVQKEQRNLETPPKKAPKPLGHDKIMEELRKLKDFNVQEYPDENPENYVHEHGNEFMEVYGDRAWFERHIWSAAKPRLDAYQIPDQSPDPQPWDPGFDELYAAMPWRQACIPDLQKQAWSEAVGDGFWNLVPPIGPPPGLERGYAPPASGEGEGGTKSAAEIAAQWLKCWQEMVSQPPPGLESVCGPSAGGEGSAAELAAQWMKNCQEMVSQPPPGLESVRGPSAGGEMAAQWLKNFQEMVSQPPPGLESVRGPLGGGEGTAAEFAAQWMKNWQERVPQPPPGLELGGPAGGGAGGAAELAAQWTKNWQETVPQPPPGFESARGPAGGGEGTASELAAQWMKTRWQETVPQPPPGLELVRGPSGGGEGTASELVAQWMQARWQETVPQPPPGLESARINTAGGEGDAAELTAQWMRTHCQETVPPLPPLRPLSRCASVDSGEFMLGAHIAPHSSEKDLLGALFANECREARRRPDPFGRRVPTKPIQYNYYTDNICEDIPTRDVGLNEPYDALGAVTETDYFKERNIEAIVAEPDLTLFNANATTEDVLLAGSLQNDDVVEAKESDDGNTDIHDFEVVNKKDDVEPKHDKNLDLMEVSEAFVESSNDIDNEFYKAIVRALKKSNEHVIERSDHDKFDINQNLIVSEEVSVNAKGLPTSQLYDECLLNNLLIKDKFPIAEKKSTDEKANEVKQILTVDDLRGVKTDIGNVIDNNMIFSDVAGLGAEFDNIQICRGRGRNRSNIVSSSSYHPIHFMQDDFDHFRGRGRGRVNQVGCAYNKNFQ